MQQNVSQKLVSDHLVEGKMDVGTPIAVKIDQTLTQDATGTLVMLTLEAIDLVRVSTEVSAQYVDHNLLQVDNLNADDSGTDFKRTSSGPWAPWDPNATWLMTANLLATWDSPLIAYAV
jgi:aconitate hydratase